MNHRGTEDTERKKRCSKCQEEYPATTEYFYKHEQARDGLRGACKSCFIKKSLEWQQNNPEKVQAKNKNWRQENPEKVQAANKNWAQENPEKLLVASRKYRQKHPEKVKSTYEKWVQENPERQQLRVKEWIRENPEKARVIKRRANGKRRALRLKLPFDFTEADWENAKAYFGYRCAVCGCEPEEFHADHWIAMSRGGGTVVTNMIPLCESCNRSKWKHEAGEWLVWKFGEGKAREIKERIERYFENIKK